MKKNLKTTFWRGGPSRHTEVTDARGKAASGREIFASLQLLPLAPQEHAFASCFLFKCGLKLNKYFPGFPTVSPSSSQSWHSAVVEGMSWSRVGPLNTHIATTVLKLKTSRMIKFNTLV